MRRGHVSFGFGLALVGSALITAGCGSRSANAPDMATSPNDLASAAADIGTPSDLPGGAPDLAKALVSITVGPSNPLIYQAGPARLNRPGIL